jgi:hypothetical protein
MGTGYVNGTVSMVYGIRFVCLFVCLGGLRVRWLAIPIV